MRSFADRHMGPSVEDVKAMLNAIGVSSMDQLIDNTVPDDIRIKEELDLPEAMSEFEFLTHMRKLAALNKPTKSYIGQGFYSSITPPVIQRNILENPGWYTQYTPYQAEISQGRLEALLNFQTVVSDLTGLPIANASLLDEGTAAAEAMLMFYNLKNRRSKVDINEILVADTLFKSTKDVISTRAQAIDIEVKESAWKDFQIGEKTFAMIVQYPNGYGQIEDYQILAKKAEEHGIYLIVVADLLSLCLLKPPGEWGAHAVVGTTQRFGIPMGFGGPHAAYFATQESFKRQLPGRIIGVSKDRHGNPALRMALQTREQHIKREKATSNICTAQALLAIMAGMYGVYHGVDGLTGIARDIHGKAKRLDAVIKNLGLNQVNSSYFDTLRVECSDRDRNEVEQETIISGINFLFDETGFQISIDEATSNDDIDQIASVIAKAVAKKVPDVSTDTETLQFPPALVRMSGFMEHEIFSAYLTETKLMRYIKRLENKDLSLVHSMIPLGSCTMKLNAAAELMPISFPAFNDIHPLAPETQVEGYHIIIKELEKYLCEITGFDACSLQPNSGAQGEYAGLLTIKNYHDSRGEHHRNVTLIPNSAHGTNPASAVMAGMKVIVVKCDEDGNIDVDDLRSKAEEYKENLSALMITYPSTHGVFETRIREICQIIHDNGGQIYMDGANMNAQVGLTNPGIIGADVCHLNLHKTFSIPHGGGGPGMGPICVNAHLAPYLPGHMSLPNKENAVASAAYGSASILLISYGYIRMLGNKGVIDATKYAILNANYIRAKLEEHYPVLYKGEKGFVAHELILDLRGFKGIHVTAEDIAKRLMDYGFHAPTLSFPVAGTIMIEPTESEDVEELDRFCKAMLMIRKEIDEIAMGNADTEDNVLHNAPHTVNELTANDWNHAYSREKAAFPVKSLKANKFWPAVGRVDNASGDRNLICTCPSIESYENVPEKEMG